MAARPPATQSLAGSHALHFLRHRVTAIIRSQKKKKKKKKKKKNLAALAGSSDVGKCGPGGGGFPTQKLFYKYTRREGPH